MLPLKLLESFTGYIFILNQKGFHQLKVKVSSFSITYLLLPGLGGHLHGLLGPAGPLPPASIPIAPLLLPVSWCTPALGRRQAESLPPPWWAHGPGGVCKHQERNGKQCCTGASATREGVGKREGTRPYCSCHDAAMLPEEVLVSTEIRMAGAGREKDP